MTDFGYQHGWFDIAHPKVDTFPEPSKSPKNFKRTKLKFVSDLHGFLQQHWARRALGVPVNYTAVNYYVGEAFGATGDWY